MKSILETERLLLRPLVAGDAEAITRWVRDPRVAEMTSLIPHPYKLSDAVEWLRGMRGQEEENRDLVYGITLRDGGGLIGVIGLHRLDSAPWAEFGYWMGIPFWGRGFATEALGELLREGFVGMELRRIEAHHFEHNPASGRVMQKAGMRYEGMQRLRARRGDELFNRVNYGLTDGEWRAAREKKQ